MEEEAVWKVNWHQSSQHAIDAIVEYIRGLSMSRDMRPCEDGEVLNIKFRDPDVSLFRRWQVLGDKEVRSRPDIQPSCA